MIFAKAKKTGQGVERMKDDYMLSYSGAPDNERTKTGLACLVILKKGKGCYFDCNIWTQWWECGD